MIARTTSRLAAAGLLLPLLLTACAGQSDQPEAQRSPAAVPSATSASSSDPTAAAASAQPTGQAADEEGAQTVSLTVSGGQVTGDTGRVRVALGERVRLTVLADATDEIHVHGYDLHEDTAAGVPATLEFVADQPGVFEVELEESRLLLTRLQVQ